MDGKGAVPSKGSYPQEKGAKGSWQGAEGSAKGTRFEGYCSNCWKWGHKARECWQGKGAKVNALQVDEPESEQKPVGAITNTPSYYDAAGQWVFACVLRAERIAIAPQRNRQRRGRENP